MSEQLLTTPQVEWLNQTELNHNNSINASNTAEAIEHQPVLRFINLGSELCPTNLPEGIDAFSDDNKPYRGLGVVPKELDYLPDGFFWVERELQTPFKVKSYKTDLHSVPTKQTYKFGVSLRNSDKGRVFEFAGRFGDKYEQMFDQSADLLMESLGYEIEAGERIKKVKAIPTPATVYNKAKDLGVQIKFFPDESKLPAYLYLGAFAEGKFPVSTKSEFDYMHDINDDHLTAMVLGGDLLTHSLKNIAAEALDRKDLAFDERLKFIRLLTHNFDNFTSKLREMVSAESGRFSQEMYQQNKAKYFIYANDIGLTDKQADAILRVARDRGRQFGLNVFSD